MKLRHLIPSALPTAGILACRDDEPSREARVEYEGPLFGLVADVVVCQSYCDPTMAADDAYVRARYGVQ